MVARRLSVIVAIVASLSALAASSLGACTCSKSSEPSSAVPEPSARASAEPSGSARIAASASASSSSVAASSVGAASDAAASAASVAAAASVLGHVGKLVKDDAGHYVPSTPAPPVDSALLPKTPTRLPDWDLDADDAARDYVVRYVKATQRYGDKTECVAIGASTDKGSKRRVEVKDDPKSKCGGTSEATRDVFLVDVGGDRLTRDDPRVGAPLKRWPDGSDPEGPPGKVVELGDIPGWHSTLHDRITALKLTVVRVELYGRGTYPLVTLAGWFGAVSKSAKPDELKPQAVELCASNADLPLTFIAGIDRSTALRFRCKPAPSARWDQF